MSFAAIIDAEAVSTNTTTATTAGVDSSGANLQNVVASSYLYTSVISDSKGNSLTALTEYGLLGTAVVRIHYLYAPTVGSSHAVTNTSSVPSPGYPAVAASWFSGAASSPFDQQNGGTSVSSPVSAGSVTPSEDNELLVTGFSDGTVAGSMNSVPTGFTSMGALDATANANGVGHAYEIQTTATARTPSWGFSSATALAAAVATFKAAAAAANSDQYFFSPFVFTKRNRIIAY